jgi:hypothetical protein
MRTVSRMAMAALTLWATAACSDDLGNGGDAGGDFTIQVGSGTQPQYSWPGPAFSVRVSRASSSTVPVWLVSHPGRSLSAPLRHGNVPSGASQLVDDDAEPTLTAGVRYRVEITLADNSMAFQEFTP